MAVLAGTVILLLLPRSFRTLSHAFGLCHSPVGGRTETGLPMLQTRTVGSGGLSADKGRCRKQTRGFHPGLWAPLLGPGSSGLTGCGSPVPQTRSGHLCGSEALRATQGAICSGRWWLREGPGGLEEASSLAVVAVAVTRVTSRVPVTPGGRVVADSWFSVGGSLWLPPLSHWPHSRQATTPEHVHGSMSRKGRTGELAARCCGISEAAPRVTTSAGLPQSLESPPRDVVARVVDVYY